MLKKIALFIYYFAKLMLFGMKKWLITLIVVVLVFFLTAYIFIPSQFTISNIVLVKANSNSVYRCLTNETSWGNFFGEKIKNNNFKRGNTIFKVNKQLMQGIEMSIKEKGASLQGLIEVLPLSNDSTGIRWTANIENGTNPFKKIKNYFIAQHVKIITVDMLNNMQKFLENEKNIYGISVYSTNVKDTLLITTKTVFKNYPSVENIYSLINMLQRYAKANGAMQTDYPILSIRTSDSLNYETLAGLPVNKELKNYNSILYKEMPSTGRLLATNKVQGGPYTISKAFKSLQNYFEDHKYISPAVPFQSIITNRMQEKDTAKWITVIYHPVY